jgi:choline dehydrogenase-like flavoprotein
MGIDATSILDPQLRVYGVDGLRVIMIGEKAADLIRGVKAPARRAA